MPRPARMAVTGFCASCAGRRGLFVTGSLSLVGCTCVLLPSLYCLINQHGWLVVREWINSWLVRNHWDVEVTQSVWKWMDWIDAYHQLILAALVIFSSLHLLATLLLILSTMIVRRNLLIPWIITDLLIIVLMVLVFVSWTFLSFFVDLLIAIVFPVMAGLLLGVWIVLWRNTWRFYHSSKGEEKLLEVVDPSSLHKEAT